MSSTKVDGSVLESECVSSGSGSSGGGNECASKPSNRSATVDPLSAPSLKRKSSDADGKIQQLLMEPFHYLVGSSQGKDVRGALVSAFQTWLAIPERTLIMIKDIVNQLHTSSLLIDDIEDDSKLRRGIPVAHSIYGVPSTINCANYVYFLAMDKARKLDNVAALDVFIGTHRRREGDGASGDGDSDGNRGAKISSLAVVLADEMLCLHRGQGLDIYWRDNNICPTEEEYKSMTIDKTGGLFRLAIRLIQAFSSNKANYLPLANNLALFFQIRDDYINLSSKNYHAQKGYCEDLTEGKFSFPIIYCILSQPDDRRLLNILRKRTTDVDVKKHAVDYMEQCGSFRRTLVVLSELRTAIVAQIAALGGNEQLSKILGLLCADLNFDSLDSPVAADSGSLATSPSSSSAAASSKLS